jgi:hypothetical protein
METFISMAVGIPLGIATSLLAWWLVAVRMKPHLCWSDPSFITLARAQIDAPMQLAVRLRNDGRRDVLDVALYAELRVTHPRTDDGVTRTVIRLPLNSPWVPRIRRQHEAYLRVESERVPDSDWRRLRARAGVEDHDVGNVMKTSAQATIRFYALAYDGFSGARQIFVADYDRCCFARVESFQHAPNEDWGGSERETAGKSPA